MSGPGLDWTMVQGIMWSEDTNFEKAVSELSMRSLLDLVTALQNAMAEEQHRFDHLSLQLQLHPDQETADHKRISAALCASQMRLARLCTRNMRCFTQQAIRAKQDQLLITRANSREEQRQHDANTSSVPTVVVTDSSPSVPPRSLYANGDLSSSPVTKGGFKENLRFFQTQEKESSGVRLPEHPHCHGLDNRINGTPPGPVPSVDNILQSVRQIRASSQIVPNGEKLVNGNAVFPNETSSRLRAPREDVEDVDYLLSSPADKVPEADYDFKDFVVHKNTFSDQDYADGMSEDAYSSVNDNDWESPEQRSMPDIPSPDYESSEEDIDFQEMSHKDHQQRIDQDEDFVDNSIQYMNDPRRYVYYPDDKELEVIPEEDEEVYEETEEDEAETSMSEPVLTKGKAQHRDHRIGSRENSYDDESTKTAMQAECDSGVTDDQHSSAADEYDLDENRDEDFDRHSSEDTDSAQGSLLPDSASESPTCQDRLACAGDTDSAQDSLPTDSALGSPVAAHKEDNRALLAADTPLHHWHFDGTTSMSINGDSSQHYALPPYPEADRLIECLEDQIGSIEVDVSSAPEPAVEREKSASRNGVCSSLEALGPPCVQNGDEKWQPRSTTINWDPSALLKILYRIEYRQQGSKQSHAYINIEGYLEKLPSGKRKATYWNPWKKRYFRAKDGFLSCYENRQAEKPSLTLQLMGGEIETMENCMIGIDDKKGHYVIVRCENADDMEAWEAALQSQCTENFTMAYVQPIPHPPRSQRDVIIVDLGSCSVRAGILMDQPSLPQVFFPTVCATNRQNGKQTFGTQALLPEARSSATLTFPVLPSQKITKYTMDVESLPGLLKKVFQELSVDPKHYKVQVCVPRSFSIQTQAAVVRTLLEDFGVKAVSLTHQAILALYGYKATSGIVVDIGDRLDIVPIVDGYIVENGVTRLPYGGQRVIHHLRHALAQKHISLISDVESYLLRHIMEEACYVAANFDDELYRFKTDPDTVEKCIPVKQFFQNDSLFESIPLDYGRFQAPEGLFTPSLWGLDSPGLHKLIQHAIQECSMDIRREMARSIYVSGGVTLLPGFPERLEAEMDKLTPPSVTPKVHASSHRYHMAYLGACQLASSSGFDQVCLDAKDWSQKGNSCLRRWHL